MREKKYISQMIERAEYSQWLKGEKVIIHAPTGSGKTTFILEDFLSYCRSCEKKVLILCNRRLLKEQYGFDLAQKYIRYQEMEDEVTVMTYQALANNLVEPQKLKAMLDEFEVIVCDEVHFFYADSDFNPMGTYVLFRALVLFTFFKTVVMITATWEVVKPLIETAYDKCKEKLIREGNEFDGFQKYCDRKNFDYAFLADYSRFECFYVKDAESLVAEITRSDKKTLIFIDDRSKAEMLKKDLLKKSSWSNDAVYILNAEILDSQKQDETIQVLTATNCIFPKVLITTSVLDNGVSIHDPDVGNVVIATESKTSFLQMLGRVRGESVEKCRLFIYPRSPQYYAKRMIQYGQLVEAYDNLAKKDLHMDDKKIIRYGWSGDDDKASFLRKALVITDDSVHYYDKKCAKISLKWGGIMLAINAFGREKVGNMLLAERNFYKLAMDAPEKVAMAQIGWIGKSPEELIVEEFSYREERKILLRECLLEIVEYDLEQLSQKKEAIAREFRRDMIGDIVTKNNSFSTEKLRAICDRYGLQLIDSNGDDGKKRYTVEEAK